MADISQIIDPKVVLELTKMNNELVQAGENMDKLIPLMKSLQDTTAKVGKNTSDNVQKQKQLTDAEKEAEKIKKQILDTENKIAQVSSEQNKRLIQVRAELQKATQAEKQLQKARDAQRGSIEQLSAVNSILEKRLKAVNLTTDEGRKKAELLRGAIDRNNVKIKENSSALSAQRINIGNYKSALEGLPGPLGNIASQAGNVTSTLAKIGPIGALVAGAIAALSAPLIAFFTKSEQGVEMLERKTAGFKAAWGVLVGEMISGGEKIADTFDKQAEKSTFWTKFMTVAGGPIWGERFKKIGERMDGASFAAETYTLQVQQLEDAERAMIVPRAEANKQIKAAMLLYNDQTKSIDVRLNALKNSIDLENQTADAEIEHQKSVVKNIQVINDEKKKAGLLRDEDDKKLQEAMAREIELSTESMGRQIRATARINAARDEMLKGYAEANKKRKEFNDAILDYEQKTADEELKIWAEQINKKYQLGLKEAEMEKAITDLIFKQKTDRQTKEEELADESLDKTMEQIAAITEANKQKEKEDAENKKQANKEAFEGAVELGNTLFDLKTSKLEREFLMAEGNAKKQAEISAKMAKVEKNQALFGIAVRTAMGIMSALTSIPPNVPLSIAIGATGAVQAGIVASKPIPKFAKGTDYSPAGVALVGERGRELIQTPRGEVFMANNPALVNLERGSKVITNRKTEAILQDGNILTGLNRIEKAIEKMPQPIFKNGSKISERRGNYWTEYRTLKHRLN